VAQTTGVGGPSSWGVPKSPQKERKPWCERDHVCKKKKKTLLQVRGTARGNHVSEKRKRWERSSFGGGEEKTVQSLGAPPEKGEYEGSSPWKGGRVARWKRILQHREVRAVQGGLRKKTVDASQKNQDWSRKRALGPEAHPFTGRRTKKKKAGGG